MTNGPSSAGTDMVAAPLVAEPRRERVKVRRRRARQGHRPNERWTARTRRRAVQTVVLCAGALLLMAAGLYFSLAHASAGPGATRSVVGVRGAA
ncbi:MAG TPA: hypothetical protein VI456_13060 [Polyangia bacterium]